MVSLTAQEQLITITIITGKRMKSIVVFFYDCCHGKMLIENSLFVFYWMVCSEHNQLA